MAFRAAEAANCAGEQGKFWEMHDRLFANQSALKSEDLPQHAQELGLNKDAFKQCLDSGKYVSDIRKNMAEAHKVGITGTPSFLIGFTEPGGKVRAVKLLVGAQPYGSFKGVIDGLLRRSQK